MMSTLPLASMEAHMIIIIIIIITRLERRS
jgi:hypothetical protein